MTRKTITKIFAFVIFASVTAWIFSGCRNVSSTTPPVRKSTSYSPPRPTGTIEDAVIDESSGLIASQCQPDVFWTHNDSGDDAFIYSFKKTGARLGTWRVEGAKNIDWEDIAGLKDSSGKCFIYIGEIGDNQTRHAEHVIYRIPEPRVTSDDAGTTKSHPSRTEPAEVLKFRYPDGNHDAETLLVQPNTGEIYVLSKRLSGPAGVYRLHPAFGAETVAVAEKVADVAMPAIPSGFITGGDVSPDGKRVIISDYSAGYEFTLPDGVADFDEIWKVEPEVVDIGKRRQGESVCYSPDGNAIYASSEGRGAPIYEILRRP
jgi:hypothetical protein